MKITEESKKKIIWILFGFLISCFILIPINTCSHKKIEKKILEIHTLNNNILSELEDLNKKTNDIEEKVTLIEEKQDIENSGEDESETVYITKYGECYHLESSCVSNPIPSTMNEAERLGLRACSKCAY